MKTNTRDLTKEQHKQLAEVLAELRGGSPQKYLVNDQVSKLTLSDGTLSDWKAARLKWFESPYFKASLINGLKCIDVRGARGTSDQIGRAHV